VDGFLAQIDAVIAHDASAVLREIDVPTLITFGARDLVRSTRFAEPLNSGIDGSELVVFEHLSHAGLHEDPETALPFAAPPRRRVGRTACGDRRHSGMIRPTQSSPYGDRSACGTARRT
jgi:hypothetical protein